MQPVFVIQVEKAVRVPVLVLIQQLLCLVENGSEICLVRNYAGRVLFCRILRSNKIVNALCRIRIVQIYSTTYKKQLKLRFINISTVLTNIYNSLVFTNKRIHQQTSYLNVSIGIEIVGPLNSNLKILKPNPNKFLFSTPLSSPYLTLVEFFKSVNHSNHHDLLS